MDSIYNYISTAEAMIAQKLNEQVAHIIVSHDLFIEALTDPSFDALAMIDNATGNIKYGQLMIQLGALEPNTLGFTNVDHKILGRGSMDDGTNPPTLLFKKPNQVPPTPPTDEETMFKLRKKKTESAATTVPETPVPAAPLLLSKGDKLILETKAPGLVADGEPVAVSVPVKFSGWDGFNAIVEHEDGRFETVIGTAGLTVA